MKKLVAILLLISALFTFSSCGEDYTYVEICFENYGSVIVRLDHKSAPGTVENFLELVNSGFYDGLTIHRVIPDFMIQGGDPNGDGTGGNTNPDGTKKEIYGEFSSNGYKKNKISHNRGTISMARSNDPDSASSQFFICNGDARASLDGKYAGFGLVVKGMSVIDKITEDVFPKTKYAEYYGTDAHSMWSAYGNGQIEYDADKPVIKYIKVLENYEHNV